MFNPKLEEKTTLREKVINALIADNKTRYAGISRPQKSGLFNVPKKCYSVLNPKFGEVFNVIKDTNTNYGIIISRSLLEEDKDNLICKVRFGSGIKQKKNRLRITQKLARVFGTCEIGFSIFDYNNKLAVRVSPKVPEPDINIYKAKNLEEISKYILFPGRSIKYISFSNKDMVLPQTEFSFRLLGGYFAINKHSVLYHTNKKIVCEKNCKLCKDNELYPLHYKAIYFPVLYDVLGFAPRPGIIKFSNEAIELCKPLVEETNYHTRKLGTNYFEGPIDYDGTNIWKFGNEYGAEICKINVNKKQLSGAEKGWMLSMRKDLKKIISEKEDITISSIKQKIIRI
jgi:hypothetical protein